MVLQTRCQDRVEQQVATFYLSAQHYFIDSIEMEQAVEVYKSLRNAAGLFEHIKKELLSRMKGKVESGSDLDPCVLEVYILQSLAEAQEGNGFAFCLMFSSHYCSCYGVEAWSRNYCAISMWNCNFVRKV